MSEGLGGIMEDIKGRKITILEAKEISKISTDERIFWRPENLPEEFQYCLVFNE